MRPSVRPVVLVLPLLVLLAGCQARGLAAGGGAARDAARGAAPDYDRDVAPLLRARAAFAPAEASGLAPGAPEDYAWETLVEGPWGETIVPFDPAGSLLLRLARDVPDSLAIPYPNLRTLADDELRLLERWIRAGARASDGRIPFADARDVLYVCEQGQNSVAIIDPHRLRVIRRIYFDDHGLPSWPQGPHHVAFEPDGSAWYVSLVSSGTVARLSTRLDLDPSSPAYLLGRTAPGGITTPGMLVVDPTSDRLYVGRSTASAEGTPGFAVVDRATLAAEQIDTLFDIPHGLAITPDGRLVVTASLTGGVLAVFEAASGDLVSQYALPGGPYELVHLAVLPAQAGVAAPGAAGHGSGHGAGHGAGHGPPARSPGAGAGHAYEVSLTSRTTDEVLFFALSAEGALRPLGAVPTGRGPWHAHMSADGRTLLVPNRDGGSVTVLDVAERAVVATLHVGGDNDPLAMPHTPVPEMDAPPGAARFFVSSSNLRGTWTPPYRFLGPPDAAGMRRLEGPERQGNLAVFASDGRLLRVIPLGFYPSGAEADHGQHLHGGHRPGGGHAR